MAEIPGVDLSQTRLARGAMRPTSSAEMRRSVRPSIPARTARVVVSADSRALLDLLDEPHAAAARVDAEPIAVAKPILPVD